MKSHLSPAFSCSECDMKFVHVSNLNVHKKRHQGVLNDICKLCSTGYATKVGLNDHIILKHFVKFNCEVTGCSSVLSSKSNYKYHLKTVHKKYDQVSIENLLINLEKLKPSFEQLKYV